MSGPFKFNGRGEILTLQTSMHATESIHLFCSTGAVAKSMNCLRTKTLANLEFSVFASSQSPGGGGLNRLPLFGRTFTSQLMLFIDWYEEDNAIMFKQPHEQLSG